METKPTLAIELHYGSVGQEGGEEKERFITCKEKLECLAIIHRDQLVDSLLVPGPPQQAFLIKTPSDCFVKFVDASFPSRLTLFPVYWSTVWFSFSSVAA